MTNRWLRGGLTIVLAVLFIVTLWELMSGQSSTTTQESYSRLLSMAHSGQVSSVRVDPQTHVVYATTTTGKQFQTTYATGGTASLSNTLTNDHVTVNIMKPATTSFWLSLVGNILPLLLIVFMLYFFFSQTQGGGNRVMQFGKSRAKLHTDDHNRVTFADVAGVEEEKQELQEVVDFLRYPKKYLELGARIPKGILLSGPPGTGKTLLAKAVAGEAGVPFFSESGSAFVEMFVGVGASRVRDMFDQAKKNAPCILFIDEIDAVGRMRGAGYGGGHDEREQTLNQLLVEMDGFGVNEGIIVVAATNRPDVLDPALLRPGRFDRQVIIHRPDVRGREAILKVHTRGKPLADDVTLDVIAKRTPGYTGADLANLCNEAALLAARGRERTIHMSDFEEAAERIMAGPQKKSRIVTEKEKKAVAFHESGHTLVGMLVPHGDPVHKVTIIPRGMAMGYTLPLPDEDRYLVTKSQILDQVAMALGGRAAEELVFGEISTGAQNDLEKSTSMVRQMITEYGMSDELGPMTYGEKQDQVFLGRDIGRDRDYGEDVASAIDREVQQIVTEQYQRAKHILMTHRVTLNRLALTLMEKETLLADELESIVKGREVAI
ncbi:MAG: cell division protein FtsH [Sulfobacillus thermosulfidooxidans]|uniref:ATP-dependent zinc metalloprotease FtsH n=1 Tax=Sulfobacillus thermotolerans TaxID=338644 RepID=A0ABN5GWW3_9FIRM|nr:cell division protein FtsH [Sulfobacillus thermotolerans]MCY0907303.1 ATP-dependent zinc metalloprotease FtsH [Sulfobacillus thermotolerans]PSR37826.1 MAG: cell division protein FtsH [Sulfobacillus thermosulfidooxidans]